MMQYATVVARKHLERAILQIRPYKPCEETECHFITRIFFWAKCTTMAERRHVQKLMDLGGKLQIVHAILLPNTEQIPPAPRLVLICSVELAKAERWNTQCC
jgi:hypothetical protein